MNAGSEQQQADSALEQHSRALWLASADQLPWSVRSRLTQARHAAVRARNSRRHHRLQLWAPAGAVAAAALALLVVWAPYRTRPAAIPVANGALEDIDLLSSDVPLNVDQDVNYEFYEWAVDEASSAPRAGAQSGTASSSSGM
ncbi:MAG: hypothetical protein ACREU2_18075 [Steroidobacteraceae bacterium]